MSNTFFFSSSHLICLCELHTESQNEYLRQCTRQVASVKSRNVVQKQNCRTHESIRHLVVASTSQQSVIMKVVQSSWWRLNACMWKWWLKMIIFLIIKWGKKDYLYKNTCISPCLQKTKCNDAAYDFNVAQWSFKTWIAFSLKDVRTITMKRDLRHTRVQYLTENRTRVFV